jgi:hypothetical protein
MAIPLSFSKYGKGIVRCLLTGINTARGFPQLRARV